MWDFGFPNIIIVYDIDITPFYPDAEKVSVLALYVSEPFFWICIFGSVSA
jgi:hypothetical protein